MNTDLFSFLKTLKETPKKRWERVVLFTGTAFATLSELNLLQKQVFRIFCYRRFP